MVRALQGAGWKITMQMRNEKMDILCTAKREAVRKQR
jgi:hypothetical protein